MKLLRIMLPALMIALLSYLSLRGVFAYLTSLPVNILTSPHGNLVLPVNWDIAEHSHYFSSGYVSLATGSWKTLLFAISPHIATIFLFHMTSLFLYLYTSLRRLEMAFILYTYFVTVHYFFFLDFISWNFFPGMFYLFSLLNNITFIYFFRSVLRYQHFPVYYFVAALLCLVPPVFFSPHSANSERLFFAFLGSVHLSVLVYSLVMLVRTWLYRQIDSSRLILAAFSLVNIALPAFTFSVVPLLSIEMDISYNALYFLPTILPIVFFLLSMRTNLVYFVIPLPSLALRFFYFVFFSLLYWFFIGFHLGRISFAADSIWLHFFIALVVLFVLDPLRTLFYFYVNKLIILRKIGLNSYLEQVVQQIKSQRQFITFIQQVNRLIKDGLVVHEVQLVLSKKYFSEVKIDQLNLLFLDENDPVWTSRPLRQRALYYPYLTQVSGGPARELLQSRGGFLIMYLQRFQAAIIISDKKGSQPFMSEDIRFLRTVLRQIEPLLENFQFLTASVQLRRKEHELELASRIQKKQIPGSFASEDLSMVAFSQGLQKVTGDYLEFLPAGPNSYLFFLGDVSGHGLGSAYLLSVIRSLVRGSLAEKSQSSLPELFGLLSSFLSHHYRGHDFMTLFGLQLTFAGNKKKSARLEYVNAGQHYPVVYYYQSQKLEHLEKSQQVLGVVERQYSAEKLQIKEKARVYLYSDGAFEIFDSEGNMQGEEQLLEWIESSVHLPLKEQLDYLLGHIRSRSELSNLDDLSMLILELQLG